MTDTTTWEELLPYDKFEKYGAGSLSDAELIAIILRTGTKEHSPVELGKQILHLGSRSGQAAGILSLQHLTLEELLTIKGIGKVKAIRLLCVTEFSRRIARANFRHGTRFEHPKAIADYYMEELRHLEQEQVILMMTDNRNQLIRDMVISKGTVNMSVISPREVFLNAVKMQAVYIILVHNHPSGDPTPSREDMEITKRMAEASEILNIPLVDHIIIGDNTYMSFKEEGYL